MSTEKRSEPEPVRLTRDGGFKQHLQWSPDGKRFLFTRIHEGKMSLWTMSADGSDLKALLPEQKTPHFDGHWSPDGKKIVFASNRAGNFEIYKMLADGSKPTRLTNNTALDYWPSWSPDGKRIAFTSNRDGNYEIYLMNADGSEQRNLTRHKAQDN